MSKFHLSTDGNPRVCRAQEGHCPLGADQPHFASKDEARLSYEAGQASFIAPRPAYLDRQVSSDPEVNRIGVAIREVLSDKDLVRSSKLLKPEYLEIETPMAGHCYVASEALYHAMGGKEAGWVPEGTRWGGFPHWWLRSPSGEQVDLTAEQFDEPVPYEAGRGQGFLTKLPSRRAQVVLDALKARGVI